MTNEIAAQKHPIVILRERLEARAGELENMTDIPPAKMIRAILTSAQIDPNILACDWSSLWNACARACRDNLLPDGKEGVIVAYGRRAGWIPMVRGKLKQFQESGEFKWVHADVVRQGEIFEYWTTQDGPHFKHVPGDDGDAPIVKCYGIATTLKGGQFVEVLNMKDIEKIRAMARAKNEDAPWQKWTSEMMKKSALHRLAKMLPIGRVPDEGDDDDDDDVREASPSLRAAAPTAPARERGAAAALDLFVGSDSPPADDSSSAPSGEGGSAQIDDRPAARSDQSAAAATDAAYERGKTAKAAGEKRSALPQEYRNEQNDHLAEAWLAGFDGKPKQEAAQ